jgi:hypothetical protein
VDRLVLADARALGLGAVVISSPSRENPAPLGQMDRWSSFIVLGQDASTLLDPALLEPARAVLLPPLPPGAVVQASGELRRRMAAGEDLAKGIRAWTDDFNCLSRLLVP